LKASTTGDSVNLWVLPYNFPVLFKLLRMRFLFAFIKIRLIIVESLKSFKGHNQLSKEWYGEFESYLQTVPPYYHIVSSIVID
jgi:hypothetical protein